jgi:hypothetical protein
MYFMMVILGGCISFAISNSVKTSAPVGCQGVAQYPCLPGLDAVGIGYDAVTGSSFGVGKFAL